MSYSYAPVEANPKNGWTPESQVDEHESDDFAFGATVSACSQQVRHGFIRKVYGILSVQLLTTMAIMFSLTPTHEAKVALLHNTGLIVFACVLSIVLVIALSCFPSVRETYPTNMITLGAFTVVESILMSVIAAKYTTDSLIQAVLITGVVCVGLTIFTFQSKYDFSSMGTGLYVALIVFSLFGFMRMFFPHSPVADTMYACIGALIFSLYLVFDTYMILNKLSPDQYIMAALNLYLDIINLFLYILEIIGKRE